MKTQTRLIGYACGLGAAKPECGDGPKILLAAPSMAMIQKRFAQTVLLSTQEDVSQLAAIPEIAKINTELANYTAHSPFFVTLGGDHTSAIGSVSGAATAHPGKLGLIWIDAHLDSHTPLSSHSKNPHGMPLATLLGHGDPRLTQIGGTHPKVLPEHVCVIGVRDYEPEEHDLLAALNVRIITMKEVAQRGLAACMQEAFQIAQHDTSGFMISFDLDALDPSDAPGTGAPVPGGIRAQEILPILQNMPNPQHLVGVDLTEFNPHQDVDQRTEKLVFSLLDALLSKMPNTQL